MNLGIGITIGYLIRTALFVTPVVVLIGWVVGEELKLHV